VAQRRERRRHGGRFAGPALLSPTPLKNVGGTLYFSQGNGELWKSGGSAAGTVRVAVISPPPPPHDATPSALTDVHGVVVFRAIDVTHGIELWRSDGTPEGNDAREGHRSDGQRDPDCISRASTAAVYSAPATA